MNGFSSVMGLGFRGQRVRLLLAVLLFAAGAQAQETKPAVQESAPTKLVVKSRLVVLDVVVTDKHGDLRNDLKPEDFQVTEDGEPQKVVYFEPPSAHAVPRGVQIHSTAELERLAPQAPATVVVLDELNTNYQDMAYARFALQKYLTAQPGVLAAPTMLLAVNSEHLQVLKDYTQDREALMTALKQHLAHFPWNLKSGGGHIEQLALSLGALEQVTKAAAGHPGHKNVLWIGHGFPGIDLTAPGLDENSAKGISNGVQEALNMLRDSRVTLYTIDPTILSSETGVTITNDAAGTQVADIGNPDPFVSDVNFSKLAKASGGKTFSMRNDVDREIAESARNGANYYTLTYRPTGASEAAQAYRKIEVKLSDPGLRAGNREGYYTRDELLPVDNVARSSYDVDAALENRLTYTGLEVAAVEKPEAREAFVVGVPQSGLSWSDEGDAQVAHVKLVVGVFDPKGKVLSKKTQELTERRPQAATAGRSQPVRLQAQMELPATASRVRFVVWDQGSGKIGTTEIHLPGTPADAKAKR